MLILYSQGVRTMYSSLIHSYPFWYIGRDCETNIDECANSPCRNGGECVDLIGNFKCICPVGYSGSLCEEAKDHCTPSPCLHGTCLNTPGGYYCHCPHGRSGQHCELAKAITNGK